MSARHRRIRKLAIADAERRGWLCFYCGKTLTRETTTADHIIATVNGGTDEAANIVASCARCNHTKADGLMSEDVGLKRAAIHRTMGSAASHPLGWWYGGLSLEEFRQLMSIREETHAEASVGWKESQRG